MTQNSSSPSYQESARDSTSIDKAMASQLASISNGNSSQSPSQMMAVPRSGMSSNASQTVGVGANQMELATANQGQSMNHSVGPANVVGIKSPPARGTADTSHSSVKTIGRHQQQQPPTTSSSSSPAFNSRHLKQQQQQQYQVSVASGRNKADSMAASAISTAATTTTNTTQASATSVANKQYYESSPSGANGPTGSDDAHSTRASTQSSPIAGGRQLQAMTEQSSSQHRVHQQQQQQLTARDGKMSGESGQQQQLVPGWRQIVSTSVSTDPSARPTSLPAWRQRSMSETRPSLPPPPPPVGYNTGHKQSQQLDQFMRLQHQNQQQEGADLEQSQLERPAAGYSYGSPTYTYTTHLSSPSKGVHLDHQHKGAAGHKQQQPRRQFESVSPTDQLARSQSGSNAEQMASVKSQSSVQVVSSPSQLPQFGSNVQYVQQQHLLSPSGYKQDQLGGATLPSSAHNQLMGATNPCRPQLSQSAAALHDSNQLQLATNELLSVGASSLYADRVASLSAAKYVRVRAGIRLRSSLLFKVTRVNSLTECELACSAASLQAGGNQLDVCNSFNYHASYAAENCEMSRYDLASLKLDDSSQFEQHSEFDFYTRRPLTSASMQLQLQQQQPLQQQQVALGSQATSPFQLADDCLDVSQSCSQDGMEFTLRTSEPFNGRIYTYGFYDSCYFNGQGSLTSTLQISRSNGFPRCGTQQIGDLMTNIVVVQFSEHVLTTRDKKYNLTCYFSGPAEAVVTSNYLDTKIDERQHPIQIEHLPPQNVVTSNVRLRVLYRGKPTNTIAVGDLLTFRLEPPPPSVAAASGKQSRDGHDTAPPPPMNEIFATNVIAKDPYSGRQVQLIDSRGCPVDATNVFPELQRTPDGALESEFYAFKIPDSSFLIFQATVRTCKSPCEPVICQSAASGTPTNTIERPPTGALYHQQQQQQASTGVKGAAGGGGSLGAYLMAPPHQSSAPSWGRRRKRQSGAGDLVAINGRNERQLEDNLGDDLIGGAGASVEHVIPVRLISSGHEQRGRDHQNHERPEAKIAAADEQADLSEAEEQVKEMFRVYLSRAEINKQLKRAEADAAEHRQRQPHSFRHRADNLTDAMDAPGRRRHLPADSWKLTGESGDDGDDAKTAMSMTSGEQNPTIGLDQVCLTSVGYYAMLFSLIALTLIVLSVLLVATYIARKAKFHISDTLADSMF